METTKFNKALRAAELKSRNNYGGRRAGAGIRKQPVEVLESFKIKLYPSEAKDLRSLSKENGYSLSRQVAESIKQSISRPFDEYKGADVSRMKS